MDTIDWIGIKGFGDKPIGAVGFIDNHIVSIVAFYDDADGNQDGTVSAGERVADWLWSTPGRAVLEVAMNAQNELDVALRDPSIRQIATSLFLSFAKGLIAEGIYKAYFSLGVKMISGGVASIITESMVKQFVIRTSFEAAVKKVIVGGLQ